MNSREVIVTSLANKKADRIGYMEMQIDNDAARLIMRRKRFSLVELAEKMHLDAIGVKNVPPEMAEKKIINGRTFTTLGFLASHNDVDKMELPNPDDPSLYEGGYNLLKENKGKRAVFTKIRLGLAPTYNSMGLEKFSYALYDEPELVTRILEKFTSWQIHTIKQLRDMDFDFYWAADDLAFKTGPFMSPEKFRKICLPYMQKVARELDKPWVFHTDGNILPIIEDLLSLGMSAIHPVEPTAMELALVKKRYGNRVCLVGNVDLNILSTGSVKDVDRAVKKCIEDAGDDGGYIVSSANSIPSYIKPENAIRLGEAVLRYGARRYD